MADQADQVYWRLLVIRCQIGDEAAFEELVTRCQSRLRGFLHKLVGSRESADDLTQEVWMDVCRDLPRLSDPAAFAPWLYRIAHNRAYRLLRRRREPTMSIEETNVPAEADGPLEFTAEDARAVHAALDQLKPEHREVLLLRFAENMTYEQIAAVIQCQLGTVRSRIHYAKESLRKILDSGERR